MAMKKTYFIILLVFISFCASGVRSGYIIRKQFEGLTGLTHLLLGGLYPPLKPKDVMFHLFTKDPQKGEKLEFDNDNTITRSSFDSKKLTKFVTHGWPDSTNATFMRSFKSVFSKHGEYNYIEIDWRVCADRNYIAAIECSKEVGVFTGNLIKKLVALKNLKYEDVHLIGHSLGAHTVSFVSRSVGQRRVGRITGLDPAAPLFEEQVPEESLDPSDAVVVDVIHTGLESFGIRRAVGSIDFYPNGGFTQPECPPEDTFDKDCNHSSSYLYFIDTIPDKTRNKYIANKCKSLEDALNGNNCSGEEGIMGLDADLSSPGIYYIKTTKRPHLKF